MIPMPTTDSDAAWRYSRAVRKERTAAVMDVLERFGPLPESEVSRAVGWAAGPMLRFLQQTEHSVEEVEYDGPKGVRWSIASRALVVRRFACPRCQAPIGVPCSSTVHRVRLWSHTRRQDRYLRDYNRRIVKAADLEQATADVRCSLEMVPSAGIDDLVRAGRAWLGFRRHEIESAVRFMVEHGEVVLVEGTNPPRYRRAGPSDPTIEALDAMRW